MRPVRCLLLAAFLGAVAVGPFARAEDQWELEADTLTIRGSQEPATGPDIVGEGHVHATNGSLQLRAPRLEIDRSTRVAVLTGGIVGTDGLIVLLGKSLRLDGVKHLQTLEEGTLLVKRGTSVAALLEGLNSDNPGCVRKMGGNALTMRARQLQRLSDGSIDGSEIWFTTCACGEDCRPLLSVSASSAHVVPDHRVSFLFPLLRLFDVPLLPLPWISFPLTNRATGLLFPIVTSNMVAGINVGAPVFITLGDSADLTVEPIWNFGTSNADTGGDGGTSTGVRGPAADLELRWRPAVKAIGSLHVLEAYDTSKSVSGRGVRGSRLRLDAVHAQALLGGNLGAALRLSSDSDVIVDTVAAWSYRNEAYLRSWAEYARVLGPTAISFESSLIEDLQAQACQKNQSCFPRTPIGKIPGVVAPVARLNFGGATRLGRLIMSEQLEFAYEDAPSWLPPPVPSHERRLTAGAALTQTLPLVGGTYGAISLDAGERAQGLSIAGAPGPGWRAGGFAGLFAQTRLARTYESGWVHDIVPALRLRGFAAWGSVPFSRGVDAGLLDATQLPQDGWDVALPSQATVQLVASIGTSLTPPGGGRIALSLDQHLAVLPFDAGQLRATLGIPFGPNRITLYGGRVFSSGLVGWGPAGAEYHRDLPVGDGVLRFTYGDGRTDDQLSRGPDLLFTPRFEVPPAVGAQSWFEGFLGLTLRRLGPVSLRLSADVHVYPHATLWLAQEYTAVVSYEVEGCGVLRLTLAWGFSTSTGGQGPLPLPVPTPEYLFGDTRDISRGVASALSASD